MKKLILFSMLCFLTALPLYAQIEDIFDKTKEKIEDEIKKEQKEKEKKEKEKLEKQKAEKKKAEDQAKDTVRVSDYHRLHTGEAAFINVQDPDLSRELGFTGMFGEKEDITACIYMDTRLESYELSAGGTNSFRKYFVKCYIDGAEFNPRYNGRLDGGMTAFALRLQGSQGILTNAQGYWDALNKLAPGDHTVKLEIWGGDGSNPTTKPVAVGEYVLLKDAPPPVVLKKFSDIVPGMQNKKLEQQALDAINRVASAEGWKERYYKAVITSYDWYIERNEWTGIIICRKLYLVMLGTWPDGSCKYTEFGVRQDHDGSRFSDVMQYNSIGGMYDAECE